jgi:hypothetical protein
VRLEGLGKLKIFASSGLESATFRPVSNILMANIKFIWIKLNVINFY